MVKKEELLPIVGGALGATVVDLIIDFPLSDMGLLYAWQIRDGENRYVWGIGTGDIVTLGIGAGLALGGHVASKKGKRNAETIKNAGIGWLLAFGCIKLAEFYNYLTAVRPVKVKFAAEVPLSFERLPLIKEI